MSEQNNTIGADTGMKQYTVVVVDDEPHILQALKRCFSCKPFQVVSPGSGAEGLMLSGVRPDLLLSQLITSWPPTSRLTEKTSDKYYRQQLF